MKKVAIDLRGLNYKYHNGVNIYTLFLLKCLYEIKNIYPFHLTAIGLNKKTQRKLNQSNSYFKKVIDSHLTTSKYLNLPNLNNFYTNFFLLSKYLTNKNLLNNNIQKFDKVILPQPKILNFHPKSEVLTVFHDIFGILGYNSTGIKQRILENKAIFGSLVTHSKQIWGNSMSTCNDLQEYLKAPPSKIKLVYPALWQNQKIAQNQKKTQSYYVAISGIEPRKNWYNLILAHHYCNQTFEGFDMDLVLIGRVVDSKYYKKLQKLIQKYSINNIEFVIDAKDSKKNQLLSNCAFTVYPSYWEGFGYPILESLAYDKPIITSKISSMPELAKDSAVYINPLNSKEIATAIYLLYSDREYYKKLVHNCPNNLRYFNQEEVQKKIKEFIFG